MIVVSGGIKGGSGKTTIATNLTIILSRQGRDVLLIDADEQETATDFTTHRNRNQPQEAGYTSIQLAGTAVRTETQKLATKYEEIVIDTGGRDTTSQRAALSIAHVLLIPFVPRSFDIWTVEKVSYLIEEMKTVNPNLKVYSFLNKADPYWADNDPRSQDNRDAAEILQEQESLTYLDTPLVTRKAFSNAAAYGVSVLELKPQDKQATAEVIKLFRQVYET